MFVITSGNGCSTACRCCSHRSLLRFDSVGGRSEAEYAIKTASCRVNIRTNGFGSNFECKVCGVGALGTAAKAMLLRKTYGYLQSQSSTHNRENESNYSSLKLDDEYSKIYETAGPFIHDIALQIRNTNCRICGMVAKPKGPAFVLCTGQEGLTGSVPNIIDLSSLLGQQSLQIGRERTGKNLFVKLSAISESKDIISRRHAVVERRRTNFVIKDEGSTNGTYVNNIAIRERVLEEGESSSLLICRRDHNSFAQATSFNLVAEVDSFHGSIALRIIVSAAKIPVGTRVTACGACIRYAYVKNPALKPLLETESAQYVSGTVAQSTDSSWSSKRKRPPSIILKSTKVLECITSKPIDSSTSVDVEDRSEKIIQELTAKIRNLEEANASLVKRSKVNPLQLDDVSKPDKISRARCEECESQHEDETSLSLETVKATLACKMCTKTLVDPVVLPCTHGFCCACVEGRIRSKIEQLCPLCSPDENGGTKDMNSTIYVRSDHLHTFVWLYVNSCNPEAQKEYNTWEKTQNTKLRKWGVSSLCTEDSYCKDEAALNDPLRVSVTGTCEGCNQEGHQYNDCPHRSEIQSNCSDECDIDDEEDYC